MNVYQRLNAARRQFHGLELKKTGHNKFAGYHYFELGDFLIPALTVFAEHGLCAVVSFDADKACMLIRNTEEPAEIITIYSPMGSAALKGCHEVQNIGAVETYQRRYLWVAALEIVEHDALDATTGSDKEEKLAKKASPNGPISGPAEIFKSLPPDWQTWLKDTAPLLENIFEQKGKDAAQEELNSLIEQNKLGPEHIAGMWSLLGSKTRSALRQTA